MNQNQQHHHHQLKEINYPLHSNTNNNNVGHMITTASKTTTKTRQQQQQSKSKSCKPRKPPPPSKCRICCRKFFAFLLSNVGLCVLVVAYSVGGAFMFRAIESPFEVQTVKQVNELRNKIILNLWNITYNTNILYHEKWNVQVTDTIKLFQRELLKSIKDGYEGQQSEGREQWSFSGAFLFSLTVISTIGYGNISPRTDRGKLMTILYAIIGIPLMLLYLTNIGDILAKSFRYVYGGLCSCKQSSTTLKQRNRLLLQRAVSAPTGIYSMTNHTSQLTPEIGVGVGFSYDPTTMTMMTTSAPPSTTTIKFKENNRVHVPITLCLLILASYVCGGGLLFSIWENWNYLDGSYFCFVTLSTIGFGDLVPGASVVESSGSQEKLVICSLYLLAGMALLAMCFNLMQEEVIHKVKQLGRHLGIVNDDYDDLDNIEFTIDQTA
ncbi:two pore domain potassium channel [Dermatophagoides farinae]|uniref:Two pore domain potassium channel n=1 Tax=Dermatophagoides farinae TaxID=6954 RepID=A0A922KXS0_DERFA|nr:two pore domain potassium channel [Dermatophagoides farinae]